ncbi:MAG: HEAT repeat domain-containing protein [Planctomycetes bacterium]|nr:HEAT repeat domain-containing protein [Planctomycetota bacterium]
MRHLGLPLAFVLPLLTMSYLTVHADELPVVVDPDEPPARVQPKAKKGKASAQPVAAQLNDDAALKQVNLSPDDAKGLIEYLKARTLTDIDQNMIGDVIKKFGDDDFDTRVKATEDIEKFGTAAIGPLKNAERDADPEIAYRARQALKRMEKVPHSQVSAAAVRALVKLKPKEAASVLIAFLPMADSEEVSDEIRTALIALAVTDGKPDPALVAALDDKNVSRRLAAYVALTEGGNAAERIRIKDAYPLVKAAVKKEADIDAKFRGLYTLLLTTREGEFVPELIDLIPKLPRGRIWQLEEFLLQYAGDKKPDARLSATDDKLAKAKEAWADWWAKTGSKQDLVKFAFKPRITGFTDIVEYDQRGYGMYRVLTLGPDLKEKAKVGGTGVNQLQYPTDSKKLPNGNYLIAEMNASRVTERDSTGKIIKTHNIAAPLCIEVLPDGGVVLICRNQVMQYDKDMKQLWTHNRQQYDIMAGCRTPGGDIVFVTNTFQGGNCFRISAKEVEKDGNKTWEVKAVGKPVALGRVQQYQTMDAPADDRLLVCEFNRVVEYEIKDDKVKELWKYEANNPTSCQRLPSGNTLITLINNGAGGKVMEIEPNGDSVWEYESKDGLRAARAFRR